MEVYILQIPYGNFSGSYNQKPIFCSSRATLDIKCRHLTPGFYIIIHCNMINNIQINLNEYIQIKLKFCSSSFAALEVAQIHGVTI